MKHFLTIAAMLFCVFPLFAQNPEEPLPPNEGSSIVKHNEESKTEEPKDKLLDSPFGLSLELASRYVWRGQEYGDAPIGFATLSYSTHGFSAWVMGAYTINNSHSEIDLGLTYTYKWATIGISDYFYPSASGEKDKYFNFNNHTTGHWGELYATVSPFEKVPFWLTASCYIYGADKKPDGKQAYSSYLELGYPYTFKGRHTISLAVGASLNRGFYTNYEKGFSVVNIDLTYRTAFILGKVKLPVSGSLIYNPANNKPFFKFSVYFNI